MSVHYRPPPWAEKPASHHHWTLLEIKGGVTVAEHALNKSCVLIGRGAEHQTVDVVVQHESCSRLHARIAFDGTSGIPWFRDLASTHGSLINKKRLPTASVGKEESNSAQAGARGVILYPGDVIQFGASTRMFCVEGPDEFARGAVRKVAPPLQSKPPSEDAVVDDDGRPKADPDPASKGVSWGIIDDEPESSSATDASSFKLPLDLDATIPDKHRKEWERLKALQYKLENITSESERIRRKGDLTEGQERQLQRNDEKESDLKEQIQERERELYQKLYPDKAKASSSNRTSYRGNDDVLEDSDFYDRTKEEDSGSTTSGDGETEQSLTAKWKKGRQELVALYAGLDEAHRLARQTEHKLTALKESGDEDAFFVQNDLDLANEKVNKVQGSIERVEREMADARKLLKIVNPKLHLDDTTGYVGLEPVPIGGIDVPLRSAVEEPGQMLPPPPPSHPVSVSHDFSMPPPAALPTSLPTSREATSDAGLRKPPGLLEEGTAAEVPPLKRKRVLGPLRPSSTGIEAAGEPSLEVADSTSHDLSTLPPSKRKTTGPPVVTLAVLSTATAAGTATTGSSSLHVSRGVDERDGMASKSSAAVDNPKHDIFVLPKDQDGSGITKLNAKFGGRY